MKNSILKLTYYSFAISAFLVLVFSAQAQVRVPFEQRTSAFTPTQNIYSIHGDFTMIGNTNMTLVSYSNSEPNSNNDMKKVDTDGISSTNNSSAATLVFSNENGANPACSEVLFAGLYWTARTNATPTELQKRTIKFRGPGESNYTTYIASTSDIRYPGDNSMYAGFVEVTEKVQALGAGQYWAADMALTTGDGGSTGYYGGWGMVVVYGNSKMQKRDITIFDGYAFMDGNEDLSFELPVSGFNSTLSGPVNMKLGMMAGEGDVSISGDQFEIQKLASTSWQLLNHGGNSTTNFFNSSIFTGGNARNPNLLNNTGLDISMFNIPNPSNTVIANGQTNTKFRYSSTQDTYIIHSICMAVDAYEPEIEGFLSTVSVNGTPTSSSSLTVLPGDEITYNVKIRNRGNEPVNNARLEIPLPYSAVTYLGSTVNVYAPASSSALPFIDFALSANGTLVWNFGTLPVPTDENDVLGEITFTLQVSEDCELFRNFNCSAPTVEIDGTISGVGANTGIAVEDQRFYVGFSATNGCSTEPINGPFTININSAAWVTANCPPGDGVRDFAYCNRTAPISLTEVSGFYPVGTRFFNVSGTVEYTITNPFPNVAGPTTYKAQLPGGGCQITFTIAVTTINSMPTVTGGTLEYCQNAPAVALTATPSNPSYTLYYYAPSNGATQPFIIPATDAVGNFTYQVAEGPSSTCISSNRVNIPVTILGLPTITATPTQPLCFGQTGSVVLASSGGTGTLTYSANNPATSSLTAGTFTYSVSDSKNCRSAATAVINAAPAQPAQPEIECWETANWNSVTCQWGVTGEQPAQPSTECWENATFNNATCSWDVTGEQPARPSTECWENATFNNATCSWDVTGEQPAQPSTECWENATFNNATCSWDVTGEQPARPSTECWENATFNNATCSWDVTGEQPAQPELACYEIASFNNETCEWDITIEDLTIPVISAAGDNMTIECPATPEFTAPTAEDSCGEVTVVEVSDITTEGSCPGSYSRTITWKAIDEYGNESAPVSQTITVADTEAPVVVSRTNDISIECGTSSSSCDLLCNADFEDNQIVNPGNWTYIDQSAVPCWMAIGSGNIIEVWGSGFSGVPSYSGLQFIELNSVSPSTVYQNFTAIPGATVDISFAHRGRAGVDVMSLEVGPVDGPFTSLGAFSAGTSQWNINSVSYTFPNNSNTNYSLRFNAVNTAGGPSVGNFIDDVTMCISGGVHSDIVPPVFADNCSDELSIDSTLVTTIIDCHVIQTYTWTATDQCGNSTSASTSITTTDTTPPVVDEYSIEVTIYCDQSDAIPAPTASDACSQVTMEYTDVLYSGGCPGTIGRSYTFTDQCGNAAYATQFITVLDNVPPVFNFVPEPRTFVCGEAYTAPVSAQASDLCDSDVQVNFTSTIAPSDCPQQQLVVNTWTAIDECLNQTTVQVTDTIIICPEIIEVTACQSYNWFDTDYTVSGIYEHVEHINGCDVVYVIDLTITPQITPAFSAVGPFCSGAVIPALPTVSNNGIQGTWSSAINNTATTNYTFTPNAGQCATGASLTIDINQPVTPTFNAVGPFCSGAVIPALPTTSVNGIQGQWSPAINNLATTNYTFTPNAGQCATTEARTITIKQPSSAQVSASACSSYPWNGQTYTNSGTYNYVTTNAAGCDSTVTLVLTINTPSVSATSINSTLSTIVVGSSVTLNVVGGSLGTGGIWKWYRGSCGGVYVGAGNSIVVSPTTTTTYFVRAEGTCNNTLCVSRTITVNPACGPTLVTSNALNNTTCQGASVVLSVTGTLSSGASWKWYKNSCGGTCIGTGSNLTVAPTVTTTYYVRSQGGACGTTFCLPITITVTSPPSRPGLITGLTTGLCNRQQVSYCVAAVSGATSYQWTLPTGATLVSGQGTNCIVVNFNGSLGMNASCGYAAICVRAVNNCGVSQSRCVNLSNTPSTTGISISGLLCLAPGTTTTYSVPSITGATQYTWSIPSGWQLISGQGTNSITVITGNNSGHVNVTPSNTCSTGTRIRRYVTISANSPRSFSMTSESAIEVLLYPNPANNFFTISATEEEPVLIEVMDISGKLIYRGAWMREISTESWETGMYIVRIHFQNEVQSKRIEILH